MDFIIKDISLSRKTAMDISANLDDLSCKSMNLTENAQLFQKKYSKKSGCAGGGSGPALKSTPPKKKKESNGFFSSLFSSKKEYSA